MSLFQKAILRRPGKSFINAIAQNLNHQKPNYQKALKEHAQYAATLKKMGLDIFICDANENFPDGNFVEDTYFILSNKLIIELNPGAQSRTEEGKSLVPYLPKLPYFVISKEFTIDGGDILKDGKNIYIGLSTRTVKGAIKQFTKIMNEQGYKVHVIPVPEGLHLKSGMTAMLPNHFIIQAGFEPSLKLLQKQNPNIEYFIVPSQENFAANILPINNGIMIPTDCPDTKKYILQYYLIDNVFEVDISEVRKVDGGLTCSSLLF